MTSVVLPSSFSASKVSISETRTLESGAKQAYVNYEGEKFVMQTATNMAVPFGLSVFDKSGPVEYSVELSFRGHETRADVKEFLDAMNALDEKMIAEGVKNSKKWFKSDLSRDVVKAFYTPIVRYSKDAEGNNKPYPPGIKLKLKKYNGEFETKFYDVKGNLYKDATADDLLVKGAQVTALMQCTGVWFAGSKYGLTWRAKQVVIHKLPEKLNDFAFNLGAAANEEVATVSTHTKKSVAVAVESEDDLVEDDEAFAEAPAPTKSSVLSAVMPVATPAPAPAPAPAPQEEEDGDDVEPVPVPKKPVLKKKVIVPAKKA